MDWITHTASAVAGALAVLLPLGFWAWRQRNSIVTQERKDSYELERIRRTDANAELYKIIDELKAEGRLQDKKIDGLQDDHLICLKKSALQEVEIYKQTGKIDFLETQVKNLQESLLPGAAAAAAAAAIEARHNLRNIEQAKVFKEDIAALQAKETT